jgi:hypothetical protein
MKALTAPQERALALLADGQVIYAYSNHNVTRATASALVHRELAEWAPAPHTVTRPGVTGRGRYQLEWGIRAPQPELTTCDICPLMTGLPSRSYAAEPDPEFAGQAVVVRVSSDLDESGMVVGWTTGPRAMANAISAAQIIGRADRQLSPEKAAQLGYTARAF